jgi:excinuclease ABC subunit C
VTWEELREKLVFVPERPGCYLMKDQHQQVIYVGKAKVLKNRVRSYFSGSHDSKTARMVAKIDDFEYIVTDTVAEALVLECNLIKHYSPHFNIMLRDDKTYPYIKITGDEHPRLEIVRKVHKDKGIYFGPYPSGGAAAETKRLLDRLYQLRKCRTLKNKVCLYYHIGQCLAPCEFSVDQARYQDIKKEISQFLNGGYKDITKELTRKMTELAEQMNFERAAELRDLITQIAQVMETQKVTLPDRVNRDVFGFHADRGYLSVQVFIMRQGKMVERTAAVFRHYQSLEEDAASYIAQYYFDNPDIPKEIWLPEQVDTEGLREYLGALLIVPKRGKKKDLVSLAISNARVALDEKLRMMEKDEGRTISAMQELANVLGLDSLRKIEAFDNSNIQGVDPVAAMVVFADGQPDRKLYRKFRIKTVAGPDDYASMKEVIRRRYTRILKENGEFPDLILVDGGKGQISSAQDVLQNELSLEIPVCGLAKDDRHRTSQLFFGDEPEPVLLDPGSPAFHLLQRIQDEVHRFAITFHRDTHKKSVLHSVLDDIPGVGAARRKQLLKHFASVKAIREASIEDFRKAGIGDKMAKVILAHLVASK